MTKERLVDFFDEFIFNKYSNNIHNEKDLKAVEALYDITYQSFHSNMQF